MAIIIVIAVVGLAAVALAGGGLGGGLSSIMGKLTPDQIATVAQNAGFSGSDLTMSVAVALAESGGDPNAVGDLNLTPGGSIGLWQINLKAHPDLAQWNLTDPQTNANAAYRVYTAAGNSFYPWSTYKAGISASLLSEASAGVTTMQAANQGDQSTADQTQG